MTEAPTVKRGRGRPPRHLQWLRLPAVAEIVRKDVDFLERMLERVPNVLPGAVRDAEGWRVPESALRTLFGVKSGPLPATATVQEVAEYTRRDVKTVYGWLKVRKADKTPMLPHKQVVGSILIEVRDVLALPSRMPGPPPSFFAAKSGGVKDE